MLTTTRDRLAAATGALYVVLIGVGNQIAISGTDQSAHPSGAQVLKDVAHRSDSTAATIGFTLEFLGFVAFIGFLAYLWDALRRRGDREHANYAAGVAIVSGITMLVIKLSSVLPSGALTIDRKTLSPQLAQLLNDMNGVGFVLSWMPFALFVGGAAVALRRVALVGRPTYYIGAFIGVAGLALALIGLQDPLNGNPIGFMLGLLWTLVVSVRLAVRPGVGARAGDDYPATDDARVAVSV